MTHKNLTAMDLEARRTYLAAVPKQFGDLHQRMKYLLEKAREVGYEVLGNDLWQALFDLENELSFYPAVRPPFGSRIAYRTSGG
jgi:hypothetical protein